jgi:hypothetical protein
MNKALSPSGRVSAPSDRKGLNPWLWCFLIPLVLLGVAIEVGCSRPRKLTEDIDWGQSKPGLARRKPVSESRSNTADARQADGLAGEERESGTGAGSARGSDGSGDSTGHSEEKNGVSDAAPPVSGADGTSGTRAAGPGGASDNPSTVTPERPAPALPGRKPAEPALSAAEAAKSAEHLLRRSQQLLRASDAAAAAAAAIEAYDQVLPHAESDAACKKLCGQLEAVLTAAGRRQGRAEAVPTRFE